MPGSQTAYLDGTPFPFNPNSMKWGFHMNVVSFDTLGGRVTQLLSVKINSISWAGECGSKEALNSLASLVERTMNKHIETERPVVLDVPSRGWKCSVFVTAMPRIGWDLRTVVFPYTLTMEVDEDYSGQATKIISAELDKLVDGIGYDPKWHGGDDPMFTPPGGAGTGAAAPSAGTDPNSKPPGPGDPKTDPNNPNSNLATKPGTIPISQQPVGNV